MRISCGPTWEVKKKQLMEWHLWFAWHSVRVGDNECRWLERVWRRGLKYSSHTGWDWEYRPVGHREET